jgi:hypothetical protein
VKRLPVGSLIIAGLVVAVVALAAGHMFRPAPPPAVVVDSTAVRVAMEREFAAFVALDSATAALADSSAVWAARDSVARARAQAADRRASAVATELTARLDSTSTALFMEYQAATAEIIEAKDSTIAILEAERSALYATINTHVEYEAALSASLAAERGLSAEYRAAWEAEQALRVRAERRGGIARLGVLALAGLAIYQNLGG